MWTVECDNGLEYEASSRDTALLCIDFQQDFLGKGMCWERGQDVGALRTILPRAQAVLAAARACGMHVLHTREGYAPDLSDLNAFRKRNDAIIGQMGPLGRFLINDQSGNQIVPEMAPISGEPVIVKAAFNAFHGTPLRRALVERGIANVVFIGITTQCCVASTLRGAVDEGFQPLVLEDCCAAFDKRDHDASIRVIYAENNNFGAVSDSHRFIAGTMNVQHGEGAARRR